MSRKRGRKDPRPPAAPRRTPPREREREGDGLWVVSDRAPDGTYIGVTRAAAAQVVADLRQDRPGLDAAFGPLRFEPIVSNRTGEPVVAIHGPRAQAAQIAAGDAKLHAVHVLETLAVADLDAGYLRLLRASVGVDEARARQVVDDLGRWRP